MHAAFITVLLAASPVAVAQAAPRPPVSPSPSVQATGAGAAGAHDRALNLVGGVWQCDTFAGNEATHTYTLGDDGSIELQTELHAGSRTFRIVETYRYDDARKQWTAVMEGGAYGGKAPAWTGYKWVFEGTLSERGQRRPVRMVYFDLGDQALRRDFQSMQAGVWQTYSAETCRRPSS